METVCPEPLLGVAASRSSKILTVWMQMETKAYFVLETVGAARYRMIVAVKFPERFCHVSRVAVLSLQAYAEPAGVFELQL